jgi:hypothetical protein
MWWSKAKLFYPKILRKNVRGYPKHLGTYLTKLTESGTYATEGANLLNSVERSGSTGAYRCK